MIDMGLVPPETDAQEEGENQADPSLVDREGNQEGEIGGGAGDDEEEHVEAVGLIGHFEAANLMTRKGEEGSFVGSLDMSMSERDLVSTEEGVGEMSCHLNTCPASVAGGVNRLAWGAHLRVAERWDGSRKHKSGAQTVYIVMALEISYFHLSGQAVHRRFCRGVHVRSSALTAGGHSYSLRTTVKKCDSPHLTAGVAHAFDPRNFLVSSVSLCVSIVHGALFHLCALANPNSVTTYSCGCRAVPGGVLGRTGGGSQEGEEGPVRLLGALRRRKRALQGEDRKQDPTVS